MRKILFFLSGLAASFLVVADDQTTVVITPGVGRIEIVSNYIIFSSGSSYDVKIPKRVEEGVRINIEYKKDDKWISDKFDVVLYP